MIVITSTNQTVFAMIDRAAGTVFANVQISVMDKLFTSVGIADDCDTAIEQACRELVPTCLPHVGLDLQEYINSVEAELASLDLN